MIINLYWITLFVLLPITVLLMSRSLLVKGTRRFLAKTKRRTSDTPPPSPTDSITGEDDHERAKDKEARAFQIKFLKVYLCAMAADWLQGPYTYPLFRTEFELPEKTVASLYMTTFIAAAISSLFVGFLADKFGRRNACLAFCLIHSLSALSVLSRDLRVLYVGQALGGLGLAMLWTVFESWMVTEWNTRKLGDERLGTMFGTMTRANCSAAVVGGLIGDLAVEVSKTRKGPFIVGVVIEAVAVVMLLCCWNENYGQPKDSKEKRKSPRETLKQLGDIKIWALSFISCCWEGTNFIVLFFWPGIIQDAHRRVHGPDAEDVPYGPIFAAFMLAMILGALLFSAIMKRKKTRLALPRDLIAARRKTSWLKKAFTNPHNLMGIVILIGGACLLQSAYVPIEILVFGGCMVFEFCNGIYVPCVAYHRGIIVNEGNRAGLYGLMKLPHFLFVIIALATAVEDPRHRQTVFLACFSTLVAASLASIVGLRGSAPEEKKPEMDLEQLMEMSDGDSFREKMLTPSTLASASTPTLSNMRPTTAHEIIMDK
ncbi:hypothetical protein QBC40DRAFT_6693 [Triangularia verruculosa]|uniref:Molybdate-anion transporter n=1 Tax=Triangularia verruculosa TaxID=2587418 RepID=A0AAN6XAQ9_9PEZI|nr:hypothetical protein QBC40DRAFT_6693 [Triangularia verruculosa]